MENKMTQEDYCAKCALNVSRLHKDLPFGCFANQADCWDGICKGVPGNPKDNPKVKRWIKNHPNWKSVPHLRYWFYCNTIKDFKDFIERYPDRQHAPNNTWESMYDTIILK